ncbi:transposase, partial [Streptomyces kebangsaanensis]|uniref:transposase n=1 Tax=Streptomyces kebangsaanensis TaxID=864058 RepID=UPI001F288D11
MFLRPRSGEQVPVLTVQVVRASDPGGTAAMRVRDRLDGLWCDEDFADRYPRAGRPGLSPAQWATVRVLQFLLGLSGRQVAEAVRCRIDFTYALAMELDDPGLRASGCWEPMPKTSTAFCSLPLQVRRRRAARSEALG